MINKKPTKIALIGAGCSVVSERLAEATKTWNLVMVSIHTAYQTLSQTAADRQNNITKIT